MLLQVYQYINNIEDLEDLQNVVFIDECRNLKVVVESLLEVKRFTGL